MRYSDGYFHLPGFTAHDNGSQDSVVEITTPKTPGEQPSWLNTALEKQKRSAEIIQALGTVNT
jgi:hypothetical protein